MVSVRRSRENNRIKHTHWKNPNAWCNHPAVKMWKNSEYYLLLYAINICEEWENRKKKPHYLRSWFIEKIITMEGIRAITPEWLGNPEFHASHRSNLKRKNPEWYGQFNWSEADNLEYVWPK